MGKHQGTYQHGRITGDMVCLQDVIPGHAKQTSGHSDFTLARTHCERLPKSTPNRPEPPGSSLGLDTCSRSSQ